MPHTVFKLHFDVPTVPEVPADACGSQMPLVAFDTGKDVFKK